MPLTAIGLNGSGSAPQAMTPDIFENLGLREIPRYGWLPVTVPGAVGAWAASSKRFGSLPLDEVLKPAMEYAYEGYPVQPFIAQQWQRTACRYMDREDFRDTFLPGGRAPRAGEIFRCPELGDSLQKIGQSCGETFYRGDLARAIVEYSERTGGLLRYDDLANYEAEWVEPICTVYRGYTVWQIPPVFGSIEIPTMAT